MDNHIKKIPWIEKYRPCNIKDIMLDRILQLEIDNIIKKKEIPNMILTGTPGTGKTTTLLCLIYKLYGPYIKDAVLELNASDDRGIQSINTNVINFCNYLLPYKGENVPYAQHKLVIFDEADNMTDKALPIISMLMDKYHKNTRFVFTCNTSSKIIESIQSRCKIFRFKRLSKEQSINKLEDICKRENVNYKTDALETIAVMSNGDMRIAINMLQLTNDKYERINLKNVVNACDKPSPIIIKEILLDCINNKLKDAINRAFELKQKGFSGIDIISYSFNVLKLNICDDINEDIKIKLLYIISEHLSDISKTIDTDVQLTSFLVDLNNLKN
jgi:replication factor C subunit 2/4